MILPGGQDQLHSKYDHVAGSTVRQPERASLVSRPSLYLTLPSYESSQEQAAQLSAVQSAQSTESLLWKEPKPTSKRKLLFSPRVLKWALISLVVYVVLTVAIGVPLIVKSIRSRQNSSHSSNPGPPPSPYLVGVVPDSTNFVSLSTFDPNGECDQWQSMDSAADGSISARITHSFSSQGSFSVLSNFTLPPNVAGKMFGNLTVDLNPDPSVDSVLFTLSLISSSPGLKARTHVCVYNNGSSRGLSLYAPPNLDADDSLQFDIGVLFPQHNQARYKSFTTSLPMFTQRFGRLGDALSFSKVILSGINEPMQFDSLSADYIGIQNAYSTISGEFNVTDTLSLDNINGAIYGNITLGQPANCENPTYLTVNSGNAPIIANVTLLAPEEDITVNKTGNRATNSAGSSAFPARVPRIGYVGQMRNFNGSMSVSFNHAFEAPALVPLNVQLQNSQGETDVYVDALYSGYWDLTTRLSMAALRKQQPHQSPPDPMNQGNERNVIVDKSSKDTRQTGWVGWGSKPDNPKSLMGHIVVSSFLSPVTLTLPA